MNKMKQIWEECQRLSELLKPFGYNFNKIYIFEKLYKDLKSKGLWNLDEINKIIDYLGPKKEEELDGAGRLKIAIWFINKVGVDHAEKVFKIAMKAYKELK